MTTGEQPFAGESMTAVSYKVVHTEPIPPSKLNPAVPIELERVILKCLEKNPANRYQTGEELAQDLENLRAGGMGSGLRATAPRAAVASTDSDETVDSSPGLAPVAVLASVSASTAQTSKEIPVAGPVKKRGGLVPSLVALAALAALGGGIFFCIGERRPRHRKSRRRWPRQLRSYRLCQCRLRLLRRMELRASLKMFRHRRLPPFQRQFPRPRPPLLRVRRTLGRPLWRLIRRRLIRNSTRG